MKSVTDASPLDLSHINEMLAPEPLRLETGIARLPSGALVVAIRTDMHGCKGRMFDWWFKFFETSQHIRWWHPIDHKEHRGWDHHWRRGERYIGATVRALQSLGDIPPTLATLKFHDPKELFSPPELETAFRRENVSSVVYARTGFGDHPTLDTNGDPVDGLMVQLTRDTPFGCVLRSRFYIGLSKADALREVPDALGLGLLRHCYNEFTFLSRCLPSLYYGEHANGEQPPLPW